ncbi:MAG: hypothetical protein M0Z51_15825, partial [Propionibacterium sp.]|nr:hypothetical protein [Propionibacterium sp.]
MCHAARFAKEQLALADGLIRDVGHVTAEAVRGVAGLYADATLARPKGYASAFHASPDYVTWYGWSELQRDLTEIRAMADELRRAARIDARLGAGSAP